MRGTLPKLVRSIIGALITLDVHARDIVTAMVTNGVSHLIMIVEQLKHRDSIGE